MPLNSDRLRWLQEQVIKTLQGETPLLDVPFYYCIYYPKDELNAISEFSNFALRLKQKGFTVETKRLSELMIEILEDGGYLKPDYFEKEDEIRDELEQELRDYLSEEIVRRLLDLLSQKAKTHCAILLRYGALWPFVQFSYILHSLTGKINCVLIIPYPSSIGEGHPLDYTSESTFSYYRGVKVDLR